jgi:hypothetical protein
MHRKVGKPRDLAIGQTLLHRSEQRLTELSPRGAGANEERQSDQHQPNRGEGFWESVHDIPPRNHRRDDHRVKLIIEVRRACAMEVEVSAPA